MGPEDPGQTRMRGILALKVLTSKKISFKLDTHPRLRIDVAVLQDAHDTPQVKVKSVKCRTQRQKFRSPYRRLNLYYF